MHKIYYDPAYSIVQIDILINGVRGVATDDNVENNSLSSIIVNVK